MVKRGIGLALLLGLTLFGGLSTGFSLYYRLAYILILAVGGGLLWSWLNLHWLEVQVRRRTTRTHVGGVVEGRLRVRNRGWLPKAWLEVEELTDLPGYRSGAVIGMARNGFRSWPTSGAATRRGVFTLGPVRVVAGDPLGLFRLTREFGTSARLVVYPSVVPLPHLVLPVADLPGDGPVRHRTLQTTPLASTVRDYAPGDAVGRVHWPTTARLGRLMVKEFDLGLSSDLWVVADLQEGVQAGQHPDSTEELLVTVAASVAHKYLQAGVPVGLAAHGTRPHFLPAARGDAQLGRVLEELAVAQARGQVALERVLYRIEPSLSRYHTLVVITPSGGPTWAPVLGHLRGRGVRTVAVRVDATTFGGAQDLEAPMRQLAQHAIPFYIVRRGQPLEDALRTPVDARASAALAYVGR